MAVSGERDCDGGFPEDDGLPVFPELGRDTGSTPNEWNNKERNSSACGTYDRFQAVVGNFVVMR